MVSPAADGDFSDETLRNEGIDPMTIDTTSGGPAGERRARRYRPRNAYAQELGARLRQIRQQKGYSLSAVEARSNEEFKASVLGAYERGERTIGVARLKRLAEHYRVPLEQLLPEGGDHRNDADAPLRATLRLDLTRVARLPGMEGDLLRRQLGLLQLSRQDFNGRVMSVRHDDQVFLAAIFGVREDRIRAQLADMGLLVEP